MLGKEIAAILEEINPMIVENFHSAHEITVKSDESIVTKTDREVEEILIPKLIELLPESVIIGEETAPSQPEEIDRSFQSEYLWAVDPIDGTTNFASGIPNFAVSVGLLKQNEDGFEPISGGISFPALSKIYYTHKDTTFCKDLTSNQEEEIQFREEQPLSTIMLPNHLALQLNLDPKNRFVGNLRFMGSSAADLVFLSLGKTSATCTIAHIWDVAAGFAIAKTQNIFPKLLSTGQIKINLTRDDFLYGETKVNWRLKNPLALCDDQYFSDVQELFKNH
jgi:myo-inositol-1(or 4)-monophosphatase